MIMRIIRAGSSARSNSSVMFAAKMSLARLKTGPLNQVASGVLPEVIVSGLPHQPGRPHRYLGFDDLELRHWWKLRRGWRLPGPDRPRR
jgi:hypothetical protein